MSTAVAPAPAIKKKSRGTKMPWATYLYKIKSNTTPHLGINADAMFVLNGIVEHYKDKMIHESFRSAEEDGKGTVKAKHSRTAAALLLDGQVLKRTIAESEKAWAKYQNYSNK